MTGIRELMEEARKNPARPIIEDLLNESETAGLHGPPEAFKTMFALQIAECLANGRPLLDVWNVPKTHSVYFFETEMAFTALGERLRQMYAYRTPPSGVHFATEARLRQFRRVPTLSEKFKLLNEWITEAAADVVILDTCNPFFRGKESPNDETTAGAFFDLLDAVPARTKLFVRHNHKRRIEDADEDAASKIRGSGQFADVPDLLLELRRSDTRINSAKLSVSKFRHGTKPDDLSIWFDSRDFRLIAVPPVIYLLRSGPLSRIGLLERLVKRFGVGQRKGDDLIAEQSKYVVESREGHNRVLEIDWDAAKAAEWFPRVEGPVAMVEDMQGCITLPLHSEEREAPESAHRTPA